MKSTKKGPTIPQDNSQNNIDLFSSSSGGKWSKEEDDSLREGVKVLGSKNWKQISEEYLHGSRTDVQCLHRWQKVLKPGLKKGRWTKEEDEIIINSRNQGITKWSEVASRIPGRIGKQCRDRWCNQLDPEINKNPWSEAEDILLIKAHEKYGNRWTMITKELVGRSDNSIKNHWNSSIKRKINQGLLPASTEPNPKRQQINSLGNMTYDLPSATSNSNLQHQTITLLSDVASNYLEYEKARLFEISEPISSREEQFIIKAFVSGYSSRYPANKHIDQQIYYEDDTMKYDYSNYGGVFSLVDASSISNGKIHDQ